MTEQKKIIRKIETHFSCADFDGKLGSVRNMIEDLIDRYGEDQRLELNNDHYEYSGDDHPTPRYEIVITREETDAEYAARIRDAELLKARAEAKDLLEYQRLSKKFGTQPITGE